MNLYLESESEVRALRDQVFGRPTSDNNWDACKDDWMTPENVAWLKDHAAPSSPIPTSRPSSATPPQK
jgi:hypothetical protein